MNGYQIVDFCLHLRMQLFHLRREYMEQQLSSLMQHMYVTLDSKSLLRPPLECALSLQNGTP